MSQKKSNSQKKARAQRAQRLRRLRESQSQASAGDDFSHRHATDTGVKIGWFAFYGTNCLCDMDALVIAGSREAVRVRAEKSGSVPWQFRSTTFGEILQGMDMGGAYAFDDEAYARFAPLALQNGLSVPPPLPIEPPPGCDPQEHLVHIRYKPLG